MNDREHYPFGLCREPGCIAPKLDHSELCESHHCLITEGHEAWLSKYHPYYRPPQQETPMSTEDVPGNRKSNNDELHGGCWAEHPDGSLILVHSTEGKRVIYDVFEIKESSVREFRGIMAETEFKSEFSYSAKKDKGDGVSERWTWHDKTEFPWQTVLDAGEKMLALQEVDPSGKAVAVAKVGSALIEDQGDDGIEPFKNADEMSTAARRVAKTLGLKGGKFDLSKAKHLVTTKGGKTAKETILGRLGRAFGMMRREG